MAVADSFDAMTSDRPYRAGLTIDEAFDQLEQGIGSQFDPICSRAFLNLRNSIAKLAGPGKAKAPALRRPCCLRRLLLYYARDTGPRRINP